VELIEQVEKLDSENIANAVKNTKTLNYNAARVRQLTDVSPIEHTIDAKFHFQLKSGEISDFSLLRYGSDKNDNLQTYSFNEDGSVDGIKSIYPVTTLEVQGPSAEVITANFTYNQDLNKVIENIDVGGGGGGSLIVDQTYNPESKNAQSGKAVAEAIGDIETVLDELHNYAQALINGGAE
jgi:hypothetical protein